MSRPIPLLQPGVCQKSKPTSTDLQTSLSSWEWTIENSNYKLNVDELPSAKTSQFLPSLHSEALASTSATTPSPILLPQQTPRLPSSKTNPGHHQTVSPAASATVPILSPTLSHNPNPLFLNKTRIYQISAAPAANPSMQ